MKSLFNVLMCCIVISFLLLSGCNLITNDPGSKRLSYGKDLIISELFTLPPNKYFAYSWIEIYNPTTRPIYWYSISNPAKGFVVGDNGTFISTSDNGETWRSSNSNISSNFKSVNFNYPDSGFACGESGTFSKVYYDTTIHSYAFTKITSPYFPLNKSLNDVAAVPFSILVYVVGDGGLILRSLDRGFTFDPPLTSPTTKRLNAICFVDLANTYIVGDSGTMLKIVGVDFVPMNPPPLQVNSNYYGASFVNDTGWVVGENGAIAYTSNAGQRWNSKVSNTTATLRSVFFTKDPRDPHFNYKIGWIVGDSGIILKTTNLGSTWNRKFSGTTYALNNVNFVDSLRGWALGEHGLLLITNDGGETWQHQTSGVSNNLLGSYFSLPNIEQHINVVLEMRAKRKSFFWDRNAPYNPGVNPNYNVITQVDTGIVSMYPEYLGSINGKELKPVYPDAFAIINNDSVSYRNHTNEGPGHVNIYNMFQLIATYMSGDSAWQNLVLWDLLDSSEVRIVRTVLTYDRGKNKYISYTSTVIDLVRWGNFIPSSMDFPGEPLYLLNKPAGPIPEWYSLARYYDDVGGDIEKSNTLNSFYMADKPIPGYYSPKSRSK